MKNIRLCLLPALLFIFAACKKSEDEKAPCKLTTITPATLGDVTNIYYDDQNRLKTIRNGTTIITLEYKPDSLIALEKRNGGFYQKKKCKLNSQSLPLSVRHEANASGSLWFQLDYEYNGAEVTKETWTNSSNVQNITNFTWSNGNLASKTTSYDTYEYEYYTDKPNQQANAYALEMMVAEIGIEMIKNKNLLKKIKYNRPGVGTYTYSYEYQFDKDGKVLKITKSYADRNEKPEFDMQYQCN